MTDLTMSEICQDQGIRPDSFRYLDERWLGPKGIPNGFSDRRGEPCTLARREVG